MLSKEQLDFINVTLGVSADELAKAISDEQEIKLELPKGRFLTPEQEQSVLDAHGKKKYDEGLTKATKEAFDGKSKDDFLSEIKTAIIEEVKLEPNVKLTEKEKAIELLQNSLKDKEQEIEKIRNESTAKQRRTEALANLPTLRSDLGIKNDEALNLILSNVDLREDGIYKNGEPIVDQYQKPVAIADFLNQEVGARGWVEAKPKGHGGKEGKPAGSEPKTYDDYKKHCEAKGWREGSLEAKEYLGALKAKNPEFEF